MKTAQPAAFAVAARETPWDLYILIATDHSRAPTRANWASARRAPLISKMPEVYALAEKVSVSWMAFARTGNSNTPKLPKWPSYSPAARDTILFNNYCRVEHDPDRDSRLLIGRVLKLT